ncbi:PPE domain-containing protein [Allokutzneria sp. A3M-2-11 16]|uniref:PPE domain-containing protein n=1 Tax=Allokutzneria sp. A3M-2-11 16 TaxID=2962043 RepID=UPI0020B83B06|nr:PPE domain-containing protein [Allokutzneria sp. A3M-2-11 16]MCP3797765.1 PPE domain-containing protein [Allokutzneria sp. A3M-2-11 16]
MDVNRNWMNYSHQELFDAIHRGAGPTGHQPAADFTNKFAWKLDGVYRSMGDALRKLGAVWEGEAADLATGKIGSLQTWTIAAGNRTNERTTSILSGMDAFVYARNSMPEPKKVPSLEDLGKSNALADLFQLKEDHELLERSAHNAHLQAAAVMQAYADAVNKPVPDYDEPPRIGGGGDPGGPRPGPGPIGGGRAITRPRGGDIGAGQDIGGDAEGVPVPPIPDQRGEQGLELPDNKLGEVQQAGYTPPPPALGGGGSLGSVAGPGGAAVGGGSGAALGALVPRAGGPLSTPSQPVPPRPTPSPVKPTTAARPGFMQPALGTSQREEDQEHERKYDITEDIVGELPMVAPPVIGE